jgi:hypothetical protein
MLTFNQVLFLTLLWVFQLFCLFVNGASTFPLLTPSVFSFHPFLALCIPPPPPPPPLFLSPRQCCSEITLENSSFFFSFYLFIILIRFYTSNCNTWRGCLAQPNWSHFNPYVMLYVSLSLIGHICICFYALNKLTHAYI